MPILSYIPINIHTPLLYPLCYARNISLSPPTPRSPLVPSPPLQENYILCQQYLTYPSHTTFTPSAFPSPTGKLHTLPAISHLSLLHHVHPSYRKTTYYARNISLIPPTPRSPLVPSLPLQENYILCQQYLTYPYYTTFTPRTGKLHTVHAISHLSLPHHVHP